MTTDVLSAADAPERRAPHEAVEHDPGGSSLPYGLLMAFVLLIYATPALLFPELDALRPTQIVGIGAVATLFLDRMLSRRGFVLPSVQAYSLLAFVAVAVLSALGALWVAYAMERSVDLIRFVAIYLVIVNVVDRRSRVEGFITTMVVGAAIPAVGALFNNYESGVRLGWVGIFENPNDLAFAMVVSVPLAVTLLSRSSNLWRAAGLLLAVLFVATTFATLSRGGLIGLVAVIAVLALRARRNSYRILSIVFVAAVLLFVTVFWTRQQGFVDLANDATVMQRIYTIQAGFNMWLDRPLLGIGLGCSAIGWPIYAPAGAWAEHWLHNHNTFVQVLGETGTFGIVFFMTSLLATLTYLRRLRRAALAAADARLSALATGLEASTWGFIVCSLSGGYLLSWFPYLLFGLIGSAHLLPRPEPRDAETEEDA